MLKPRYASSLDILRWTLTQRIRCRWAHYDKQNCPEGQISDLARKVLSKWYKGAKPKVIYKQINDVPAELTRFKARVAEAIQMHRDGTWATTSAEVLIKDSLPDPLHYTI